MAGVLAAAATAGATLAMAWRGGAAARPFQEVGRAVLGGAPPATTLVLGVGLHVAVSVAWGLLLAAVAARLRGPLLLAAGAIAALLAWGVHSAVLPAFRLGYGLGVFPLRGAPVVLLYALFALGLAWGIRLAR